MSNGKSDKEKINESIGNAIQSIKNFVSGEYGGFQPGIFENDDRRMNESYSSYYKRKKKTEEENQRQEDISNLPPLQGLPPSTFGEIASGIMADKEIIKKPEVKETPVKTEITPNNNAADNANSITNTANSNNAFDSGAFSFIDDLGDNSGEQLKKVNATADAAIDQGYKDAVEKTTTESMGAAKAGEKNRFSKTRGGLFGNYGKEVTINKIVNPDTGKVSREKFVDGKYVSSTAERKNFRKQKKEGRQKARQQKISNIKDKVTGVFEKSKENRTKRQKARSSKKNNNSGSSSNFMMSGSPFR